MKFGVCLPNYGSLASREAIIRVARLADELGYDSVWATDHILVPKAHRDPYGRIYEAFMTLGFLSSICEKVKLGTSIIVLPIRNPIVVAKQAATIDVLSGGRVILGVGAGWIQDEFRFLNSSFKVRGRVMDEGIKVLRTLWADEEPSFRGRYTRFSQAVFAPKPVQKNGPPIWIGGNSDASIKRATEVGDAWHPVGLASAQLQMGFEKLKRWSRGRKVSLTLRSRVQLGVSVAEEYRGLSGERRRVIWGDVRIVANMLEELRRIGLEHLVCFFGEESLERIVDRMKIFGREVMPSFKS